MNLGLANKRVLVTGSSRGIGFATAKGFLEEKSRVALTGRTRATLLARRKEMASVFPPGQCLHFLCDFTVPARIAALRDRVERQWGGLDILVVNVGSGRSVQEPIPGPEQFRTVFSLNFESAVETARAFYPLLKKSQGNILFVSSIAGVEAIGAPVDYSVAKAGVIAFSKNLARKAAGDGVRVNTVAPGNVYFEGGTWDEKTRSDAEGVEKLLEEKVPMKRFAKPEEIADAILFLCSERASFITGACLTVDGGQTFALS